MIARAIAITLIPTLFVILTLASSAWAECAWVLWITTYGPITGSATEHRIDAAYPELAGCVARLKQGGEMIAGAIVPDESRGRFLSWGPTSLTVYEKSVPKNDPRGPKGASR